MANEGVAYLAGVLGKLHEQWTPHKGQIKVGQALFRYGKTRIFVQCGRKWGKSEFLIYTLVRWAMLNTGSHCYYFAPFQKQAREILWVRLKQFIPQDWIKDENKTEARITLITGSFIKIDGSDNYEAYRGITPDIVAYDEFKDFRPEFHVAMEPNLGPKNAPLLIVGTPPDVEGQYTELAAEMREDGFWIEAPSEENPHMDKAWLDKMKAKLISRGEADVWEREYMGRFIKGGSRTIFPMFKPTLHVVDYAALKAQLRRDIHKLQWFIVADPGTTSVFAAIIVGINQYTRQIYVFDEVYETVAAETTTGRIWPHISALALEANPNALPGGQDWYRIYDEAASWFAMESLDRFNVSWVPTQKAAAPKDMGLSLIKDLLLSNQITFSSRCVKGIWEIENYALDAHGRIPKKNDHIIDTLRYLLHAANYTVVERKEPRQKAKDEMRRGYRMEEDFPDDMYDMPDEDY